MAQDAEHNSQRIDDKEYSLYLDERKSIKDAALDYAKSFDRWIITLSSGALGLSIAFVKDLVTPGPAIATWALGSAWILFGLATVVALACIYLSQVGHDLFLKLLDEAAAKRTGDLIASALQSQSKSKIPTVIERLNFLAIALFFFGFLSLGYFLISNLP